MSRDRVFDLGYRGLPPDTPRQPPAWAIARTMLMLAWRQRSTKVVLLVCLAVLGGHGLWLVSALLFERFADVGGAAFSAAEMVGEAREVLANFLRVQFFTSALAVAVIAGGAVADDRAAGAFDLYFARPLTRRDYALGKLGGAALVPIATLLLPSLLLWVTAVGIAPDDASGDLWWLVVPSLAGGLCAVVVLAATIIGLSSLGQKGRTVTIVYIALMIFMSSVLEGIVAAGYDWAGYLAPERDLHTVVEWLFEPGQSMLGSQIGSHHTTNSSALGAFLGLCGWAAAGLGLLWHRLRTEVVG